MRQLETEIGRWHGDPLGKVFGARAAEGSRARVVWEALEVLKGVVDGELEGLKGR